MSDKNIIYVEKEDDAPFVFLCGQMLRNVVMTVDPEDGDYQELCKGEVWAMRRTDCQELISEVSRSGIDFETRYVCMAEYYTHLDAEYKQSLESGEA